MVSGTSLTQHAGRFAPLPPIARQCARGVHWLAAGLLLCLLGQPLPARPAVLLDAGRQPVALADAGQYRIDTTGKLGPEQVASNPDAAWLAAPASGIYPLLPRQALWIRLSVSSASPARWLLDIPYPALDRASLYTPGPAGGWLEQHAGDLIPVNSWPVPHRHPLLVVDTGGAPAPVSYLLRIENAQGFSAPLRFVTAAHLLRNEQKLSLFLGCYFGLAVLGGAVGLAGFLWLRDRVYLYYGLCSALVGLLQAAITGVAGVHLWPDSPQWTDRSLVVLATWMLMSLILLTTTIVSLAQRSRMLHALVWVVVLAGGALSVALGVTDSAIRLKLLVPYLLLVPTLVLLINFWAWRHGDPFGGWLLLSATPFAIGLALAIARYLQWIPQSFATEHGVLASMALELPAILAVLILRSRQRRENTRRIRGLDRMDPTTGLINGPVFVERLVRMMARSERLKHQGAVLLIDIVNTEQIQRDFGRKAADELPLRVAERLLSTAREIDSAARLSERRFGMLVEGPFAPEDAATLGPRVVARCLMPYKGLHVDCVAQVRVAYALVPCEGAGAQDLLGRLEERLAAAPGDDRKAVFMLGEAPPPSRRRSRSRPARTLPSG
ncbi:MAG: Diguanylate cyclase [Polaromonas sp.]|nr:Diguanylate cyclase [Polaromonas sp.]